MTNPQDTPPTLTTDGGIPVESDEHSITVSPDGPIVLIDHYLIEQMAQFNRERIAERQPHAKGSGAFGRFVVTHDVSAYTKAALFQPGTTTETVIRFSTVAGERGSPDTWRDLRGVAMRFYTSEGNYDLVGNDTPVFFVRDPLHFQHFIRSQKRLARNNLRSNDMQWDFWTLLPRGPVPQPGITKELDRVDDAMRALGLTALGGRSGLLRALVHPTEEQGVAALGVVGHHTAVSRRRRQCGVALRPRGAVPLPRLRCGSGVRAAEEDHPTSGRSRCQRRGRISIGRVRWR